MAYDQVRLKVYDGLANETTIDPPLYLTVINSQIIDFDIEPDVFAADDAFSIRGKTATVTMVWEDEIQQWLQSKVICSIYPEYLNYVIDIENSISSVVLFRGALRIDDINHNYDQRTVTIRLRDALDIWITQAKKTYFTATDDVNSWSTEIGHNNWVGHLEPRSFEKLLTDPVRHLLKGLNTFYREFTDITPEMVYDLPLEFESYFNDFSYWTPTYEGMPVSYDWQAKYVYVRHDADSHAFQVNLIHVFMHNRPTYYYRVLKLIFNETNLLQTRLEKYIEIREDYSPYRYLQLLVYLTGDPTIILDSQGHIIMNNVYTASHTDGTWTYTLAVANDVIYASTPYEHRTILLSNGKHSYADITFALLTANALTITTDNVGSKHIVNSGLSSALSFTGGTVLGADYIINQQRTGTFADMGKLESGLSIARYETMLTKAIQQIYAERLGRIGAKLTFQMPVSYRDAQALTVQSKIIIDSITYVITSMGFPQDGLVEIECIGEWE